MTNVVQNYGWHSANDTYSMGYVTPVVLEILNKLNAKRICDLGSGNGALASHLKGAGFQVVGVENDAKGCEIAQANFPDIKFYNLGVQDDPAEVINSEESLFDAVVSTEVIEHLFSPHLLPIFAKQLLVNIDGYLVISTPYHGFWKNLALSILNKWDDHHTALWHGGHIKFWSRNTLTQLLEQNGFQVVEFYGAGRLPYLWKSMILVAKAI